VVSDPPLAVLVSTHDRHDDARVNMEIIRAMWPEHLGDVVVVHAYNGPRPWTPYLEDQTIVPGPGASHYTGAADLIDAGSVAIAENWPDVRHVVYLASDTWLYRPERLRTILDEMRARELRLATAPFEVSPHAHGLRRQWGGPHLLPGTGFTTDFFVLDLPWAREFGMLPLDLAGFINEYGDLLAYFQEIVLLERLAEGRYLAAVRRFLQQVSWPKDALGSEGLRQGRRMLRLLHERPIDPDGRTAPSHKGHWPDLGLITIEDPVAKRTAVREVAGLQGGDVLKRFLEDEDLRWFNGRQDR
jgi:hypothetical protein